YTKNILFEGRPDVTRILFHSIEQHFAGEKSRTFFLLDELEKEAQLFSDVAERVASLGVECSAQLMRQHLKTIHEHTVRRLAKARTLGSMAQACMDVLTYIDEHSTARRHPLFRPYVETLIESLDGITSSMLADAVFADHSRAMAFLGRCVADAQVPFPGTPLNGLQVLGFLETRNLRFDNVFVLDVNEDVIPGSGGGHTLIPQQIREKLGLPTYHQQEEIAAYYFDLLISGAREVHLFFSENAQKEKSRFVEELLWERQQRDGKDETREYIQSIGYKVWLANPSPESIQKRSEVVDYLRQFTYHSTALDMYLSCPLRFYYNYVLGLKEKEEVAGDIESSDVGSFVHEVLKRYLKDTIGKRLTPEDLDVARLNRILDEQFPLWFGVEQTGAKYLLQRQVRTQLGRFLADYQQPICNKEAVTLLELESKVQRVSKNHFTFSGKLDRIERRGEKIFILDYKTGGDEKRLGIDVEKLVADQRETWSEAIGSLQLPMYMMLYSESRQKTVKEIVPAYLLLGRNKIDEEIELRLFEDGVDIEEVYAKLERIIFILLEEITNAAVPFAPTSDIQEHCPRCPFTTMCGTSWVKKPAF
ncbi:MAG TPA: hypothetical protein DGH68_09845, partial [Bacteroidetes bacterium]|nr:hypothetical protein [Bacteroidota bacterium]